MQTVILKAQTNPPCCLNTPFWPFYSHSYGLFLPLTFAARSFRWREVNFFFLLIRVTFSGFSGWLSEWPSVLPSVCLSVVATKGHKKEQCLHAHLMAYTLRMSNERWLHAILSANVQMWVVFKCITHSAFYLQYFLGFSFAPKRGVPFSFSMPFAYWHVDVTFLAFIAHILLFLALVFQAIL